MGQYWVIFNFAKKQYFTPLTFDSGLKIWEMMMTAQYWGAALGYLLADSECNGKRGGDLRDGTGPYFGSWAGDNVKIIGDYGEDCPDVEDGWVNIGIDLREETLPLFRDMEEIGVDSMPKWIEDRKKQEVHLDGSNKKVVARLQAAFNDDDEQNKQKWQKTM